MKIIVSIEHLNVLTPTASKHKSVRSFFYFFLIPFVFFGLVSCEKDIVQGSKISLKANLTTSTPDSLLGASKKQKFKQVISANQDALVRLQLRTKQNEMFPTGFYIDSNTTVVLDVTKLSGTALPQLVIGTPFDGVTQYRTVFQLQEGRNTLDINTDGINILNNQPAPAKWGGNAFIQFTSESANPIGEVDIVFGSGFKKIPYYVKGSTDLQDYQRMLDLFGDSVGTAMLVSDRTMMSFSIKKAREFRFSNQDSVLILCDQIIKAEESISGLDGTSATHQARKNRILITEKPSGSPTSGGSAIAFPIASMPKILTPSLLRKEWGMYHEIGHTHQQIWTWGALGEVTVNIYSLAAERAMGVTPTRLVKDGVWPIITNYLAKPIAERNYNTDSSLAAYGRLGMFHQLWLAYGDSFYQNLHKKCRDERPVLPADNDKMRYFMLTACKVSGKNLTDFFKKWGLPVSASVYTEMLALGLPVPSGDLTTLRD